ncbi:hypothetical protein TOPH_00815 [Tolypocladium ophioglossoides CBS 100239]|uniref:Zn(2)-C6 fungal-type domain-containing protein n=1 Tax=Tolypocladium ophioglossoides (strain CBS 100239) TaxID=1163406 RepID=A0A0L0NKP8_TOLOC|nr:hypothetical protein TOPH_00815 [Tolypocladium ophioglossoides CBS 100239]
MFGTWRVDPETEKLENLRRAYDPITARSSQHQACDRCHEKKLKCSGEKEGCDRCAASRHKCEYTRSGSQSSRKGKKSSRHSTDSPSGGRETSGSPSSRGTSHGGQSSKSKGGHGSSHRTHAPAAAVLTQGGHSVNAYGMDTLYPSVYDSPLTSHLDNHQQDAAGAYQHGWTTGEATMHTATTTSVNPALLTADQMHAASGDYQYHYQYQDDYEGFQNIDPQYWPQ